MRRSVSFRFNLTGTCRPHKEDPSDYNTNNRWGLVPRSLNSYYVYLRTAESRKCNATQWGTNTIRIMVSKSYTKYYARAGLFFSCLFWLLSYIVKWLRGQVVCSWNLYENVPLFQTALSTYFFYRKVTSFDSKDKVLVMTKRKHLSCLILFPSA